MNKHKANRSQGCVVTQGDNPALRIGVGVAGYWQTSSLSSLAATSLLSSYQLPELIGLNASRLSESYHVLTEGFLRLGVTYIPANAGLFVLTKLAPQARTREEEQVAIQALASAGIYVAPGRKFGIQEIGWVRVTFSLPVETIKEVLERIECYLSKASSPVTTLLGDRI